MSKTMMTTTTDDPTARAAESATAGRGIQRRGLIAGAAALAATLLAARATGTPQAQAVASSLILGNNDDGTNTETAPTTLVATGTTPGQGGLRVKISYTATPPPVPDPTRDAIQGYATNPLPNPAPIVSNAGVHGRNDDLDGIGVAGVASGGTGVYGQSSTGSGVGGSSGGAAAVYGRSAGVALTPAGTTFGVYGEASGTATGSIGIYGVNLSTTANSHGMVGIGTVGHGLVGTTNYTPPPAGGPPYYGGLIGFAPNGASAGLFFGSVSITGTLNGHTAIMQQAQVAVAHPDGTHRLTHSVSATEAWLEEVGSGKVVVGGKTTIALDGQFAALAEMSDYHVFLTEYDGSHGLYVTERTASGFAVHTAPGVQAGPGGAVGTALVTAHFSWKVLAKRKDVQGERLATFTYPKLVAPEIAVHRAPSEAASIANRTPLPLPNRR